MFPETEIPIHSWKSECRVNGILLLLPSCAQHKPNDAADGGDNGGDEPGQGAGQLAAKGFGDIDPDRDVLQGVGAEDVVLFVDDDGDGEDHLQGVGAGFFGFDAPHPFDGHIGEDHLLRAAVGGDVKTGADQFGVHHRVDVNLIGIAQCIGGKLVCGIGVRGFGQSGEGIFRGEGEFDQGGFMDVQLFGGVQFQSADTEGVDRQAGNILCAAVRLGDGGDFRAATATMDVASASGGAASEGASIIGADASRTG